MIVIRVMGVLVFVPVVVMMFKVAFAVDSRELPDSAKKGGHDLKFGDFLGENVTSAFRVRTL